MRPRTAGAMPARKRSRAYRTAGGRLERLSQDLPTARAGVAFPSSICRGAPWRARAPAQSRARSSERRSRSHRDSMPADCGGKAGTVPRSASARSHFRMAMGPRSPGPGRHLEPGAVPAAVAAGTLPCRKAIGAQPAGADRGRWASRRGQAPREVRAIITSAAQKKIGFRHRILDMGMSPCTMRSHAHVARFTTGGGDGNAWAGGAGWCCVGG